SLPGEEVVTATRVNDYGEETEGAYINNTLYVANSKSSGEDYQAQYGGEFLDYLQETYPEMFEVAMISTGEPIDPSTKIKIWKAEYFNGTNILGKGAGYVLSDAATGTYFTVTENGTFLPKQLTTDSAITGFYYDGTGMSYFSTSGYRAKASFNVTTVTIITLMTMA
ncbi:glycoside hydrolase family 70 protein, partial [Staphylococcus aureus]|uniref:glycoside hydrolase family 70 protein n=1 Tax=Staphylococcus aureus TaxID=1280 RepID=UPI00053B7FC0